MNNQWFSKIAVWLVIALVLLAVFKQFDHGNVGVKPVRYSDFLEEVRSKHVKSVVLQDLGNTTEIQAEMNDGSHIRTNATNLDRGLIGDLINNGVQFDVKPREEQSFLIVLLYNWGPMLLLVGIWIYFMRQM